MSCAPYGYRYISSQEGGGGARFEPIPEQARVVPQIFTCVGRDRFEPLSSSPAAATSWRADRDRQTVVVKDHRLSYSSNLAYKGQAAYGKPSPTPAPSPRASHPSTPQSFHRRGRPPGLDLHSGPGAHR